MAYKRTLGLDSDGDVAMDESKRFVWRDGARGVEQELKTLLKTVRGEDPLDPDHGLDVFAIAGAPPAITRREIRRALTRDDRVATVGDIRIDRDDDQQRHLDVSIEVLLVDGEEIEIEAEV